DPRRKRGRPPRVDTPMECRIKNIMKGLRKCKDEHGNMRVAAFERLPDAKQFPDYYQEIKNPIALDGIRKRIKRREYKSVEQFEVDIRQMCENAKDYNRDDSQIFRDAVALEEELANLAEAEKARDDSEFQGGAEPNSRQGVNKQMRIPLKSIEHKGETYVIGDWVHIINPNDLSKPTVAQVYRTWEDSDGQKWINACWYYRPEQTVHRYDRRFYEHEVVKTGQYRDHQIDEVLDKCFVMFFTRYSRGRPKGIGNRQVYVCESRYNEAEKHFNKIKTWKSCIPDEVRGQDYEMDLFEKQEPLKKFPSPIAHLLPPNATETDPIPEAKMGAENAPPIVGAVFKRPRGPNVSFDHPKFNSIKLPAGSSQSLLRINKVSMPQLANIQSIITL
ncbi:Bromodomain-containing protein, partial [Kalaharituber pfeilii]